MAPTFPDSRLRRAGATRSEILDLGAAWTEMDAAEQAEIVRVFDGISDSDIAKGLASWRTGGALLDVDVATYDDDSGGDGDGQGDGQGDAAGEGQSEEEPPGDGDGQAEDENTEQPTSEQENVTELVAKALERDVAGVLTYADNHPDRVTLLLEQEKAGQNRKTVVGPLEKRLAAADQDDAGDGE